MKKMNLALSLALTCALAASLAASPARASDLTAKIQKQYESIKSFQADFLQELTNAGSQETTARGGRILFQQPGLVRWDTVSPERESLIVGQDVVWDYFADEKLAMKYKVSQVFNSKTMLRFITGQARLDEDFKVAEAGQDGGMTRLNLTPKEAEPGLVEATVWVDPAQNMVKAVKIKDFYGNTNYLRLDKFTLNLDVPKGSFEFAPPKGVDVQDNTKE